MEHTSNGIENNYMNSQRVSFVCVVLCITLGLILGVLSVLPTPVTQLFRPAFIALCLLTMRLSRYYPIGAAKTHIISLLYYTFILFNFTITKSTVSAYISIALFIIYFVLAANRVWTKKEIRLILITVALACTVSSVITLVCNPGIFKNSGSAHIDFLGVIMNRNTLAFCAAPGALCGMFLLLYDRYRKSFMKDIFYLACCLICSFALFSLACRSAFFAAAVGLTCIVWQKTRDARSRQERFSRKMFAIFLILLVLATSMFLAKGTFSSRLFEFGGDDSDSGRDVLWDEAWELIDEKPVFGGGFDYWTDSGQTMGTHNAFLTFMVSSGWTGGILLGIFLFQTLLAAIRTRNLIPLGFAAEVATHTWTEPGMDYFAYIPLILTFILIRYLKYQNKDFNTIFS